MKRITLIISLVVALAASAASSVASAASQGSPWRYGPASSQPDGIRWGSVSPNPLRFVTPEGSRMGSVARNVAPVGLARSQAATCNSRICAEAINLGCSAGRVYARVNLRSLYNNQHAEVRAAALFNAAGARIAYHGFFWGGTLYAGGIAPRATWQASVPSGGYKVRYYVWTPEAGTVADSTYCHT
jgi:hypothetical protein